MSPISLAQQWSRNAQQQARRNAMVALTQCTQRRVEREDVERFLAARAGASGTETIATSISLRA